MPDFKKNKGFNMKNKGSFDFGNKGNFDFHKGEGSIGDAVTPEDRKHSAFPFKSPMKQPKVNVPPGHDVIPPSKKQSKESKGTLKAVTGFEADHPFISKVLSPKLHIESHKKLGSEITKKVKKGYDYFTKK